MKFPSEGLYVVCDAYGRFATGTIGKFSPEFPDGATWRAPPNKFARLSAKKINDTTCVIRDYGLETQEIVASFDARGKAIR